MGIRKVLVALVLALVGALLPPATAHALPPHAAFSWKPQSPLSGQQVTFTSSSTPTPDLLDPGPREIVELSWDFDEDGQIDASGPTANWTFERPGEHKVELEVADNFGERDTKTHSVVVRNQRPVPVLALVPAAPAAGQQVALTSKSYDPDGSIVATEWDLDGDGAFDDATGTYVTRSFGAGGWAIGLRVRDDSGASEVAVATIFIPGTGAPGSGSGSGSTAGIQSLVRVLSPFPVVRISGIVRRNGIKLRLLSVSAPLGAKVSVRCRGRGCPFKKKSQVVKAEVRAAAPLAPATGLVRIRRFARRVLRTGAIVRVFVTRPDAIGKYTRLRVRPSKAPARVDRCVTPAFVPLPCPTG